MLAFGCGHDPSTTQAPAFARTAGAGSPALAGGARSNRGRGGFGDAAQRASEIGGEFAHGIGQAVEIAGMLALPMALAGGEFGDERQDLASEIRATRRPLPPRWTHSPTADRTGAGVAYRWRDRREADG